jgi:sugar O-acyltransferase (sialic acid O-acetyltransferase NeuD family)
MDSLLVIWGAGGHGKVVLDVARSTQRFERIVFVDDNREKSGPGFCDCPMMGGPEELHRFPGSAFVIAIGENRTRARCFSRALARGLLPATLVHLTAIVSPSARIEPATVVMPGAIINAGATIGENCIINTGAIVEHDCQVADHVHISPRVALGGGVTVGSYAHIGIGAVVLPGAAIGDECVVGAGAVVLKEAPARCTVVGVPARLCQTSNPCQS